MREGSIVLVTRGPHKGKILTIKYVAGHGFYVSSCYRVIHRDKLVSLGVKEYLTLC